MSATTYDFDDVIMNDTVDGVSFVITDGDGDTIDLTGAEVNIWFRKVGPEGPVVRKFSSLDGTITVEDNEIALNSFVADLDVARYFYDMQINFSDGTIKTWIKGSLRVLPDVTKP